MLGIQVESLRVCKLNPEDESSFSSNVESTNKETKQRQDETENSMHDTCRVMVSIFFY